MRAGSIVEVSVRGRRFTVAADSDASRDLGGEMVEAQPNGDGTVRYVGTRKPWKVGGLNLATDDGKADQEFLVEVSLGDEVMITFTYPDNTTYEGKGKPTGDIVYNNQSGTIPIEFSGGGSLSQQ